MNILITGGTGLLGKALVEKNSDMHKISAVYLGNYDMSDDKDVTYFNLDVCDETKVASLFSKIEPEVVIHTAGMANVDRCEDNYNAARRSNVNATSLVTGLCGKYGSKMVYISTNAVFDGKEAPYSEKSKSCPVNTYGKLKVECEEIVKNSGVPHLIVRPILMYGWNNINERPNMVTWLMEKLHSGTKVNIVDDVYENPLFNHNCAEVIWSLVRKGREGLYHISGSEIVNRYQFAVSIADMFDLDKNLISPVSSDFFRDIAPRPRNTSYDSAKAGRDTNIKLLGIREGLSLMMTLKKEGVLCRK